MMETTLQQKKTNHTLSAQFIRIFLFVYVYIRAVPQEICFLDSFLNPLFFFLDGMAFSMEKDFSKFTFKNLRRFIFPYYFLAILLLMAEISFAPVEGLVVTPDWFFNRLFFYIGPEIRVYSLWYLPSLFCAEMIVYGIILLSRDNLKVGFLLNLIVLALSLVYNHYVHVFLPWSMDTAFIGSFYLYLGYLLVHRKNDKVYSFLFQNRGVSFGIAFFLLLFSLFASQAIFKEFSGSYFSGSRAFYSPYQYVIPLTFVGIAGILFLAHAIGNVVFVFLGRMTLVILFLEQEIGIKLYKYFIAADWYRMLGEDVPFDLKQMGVAFLGVCFIVLISIPVYYLFMETPLCVIFSRRWVPYGKRRKEA